MFFHTTQTMVRVLYVLILCAFLSNCVVYSQHALSKLGEHTSDARLNGVWAGEKGKPIFQILVREDGWITISMTELLDRTSGLEIIYQKAIASEIDSTLFLNVQNLTLTTMEGSQPPPKGKGKFIITKIEFSQDGKQLKFFTLNENFMAQVITDGKLKGAEDEDKVWVITAPVDQLVRFIQDLPKEAFEEHDTLNKILNFD